MLLCIAGINHFNPIHRSKLETYYQSLKTQFACAPAFLALEYEQNFATEVIDQRNYFRGLCKNEWPNLSDEMVDNITKSLLYEVDSHTSTFAQVPIIWLDSGRTIRKDLVDNYSDDRLKVYKYFLETASKTADSSNILDILFESANASSNKDYEPSERDMIFANKLIEKINSYDEEKMIVPYSIVVVGSNHAKNLHGSMKHYLDVAEIDNIVSFL